MNNFFDVLGIVPTPFCTLDDVKIARMFAKKRLRHEGGSISLLINGKSVEYTIAMVDLAARKITEVITDGGLQLHLTKWEPFVSLWNPSSKDPDSWMEPIPDWESTYNDTLTWSYVPPEFEQEHKIEELQYAIRKLQRQRTEENRLWGEEVYSLGEKLERSRDMLGRSQQRSKMLELELAAVEVLTQWELEKSNNYHMLSASMDEGLPEAWMNEQRGKVRRMLKIQSARIDELESRLNDMEEETEPANMSI